MKILQAVANRWLISEKTEKAARGHALRLAWELAAQDGATGLTVIGESLELRWTHLRPEMVARVRVAPYHIDGRLLRRREYEVVVAVDAGHRVQFVRRHRTAVG